MANIRLLIVVTLHVVKSVPVCLEKKQYNNICKTYKICELAIMLSLESVKVKI